MSLRHLVIGCLFAAVLAAPSAVAHAAPAGPEGPANCTFARGVTTCASTSAPVIISQTTSDPDVRTGCTTTTAVTETTTTYTAHHGTYNSHGSAAPAPDPTTTDSENTRQSCPVNGAAPMYYVGINHFCSDYQDPANEGDPTGDPIVGTVYWWEDGSDVHVHYDMTNVPPDFPYAVAARCVAFIGGGINNSDGTSSTDAVYFGGAGTTVQFDYESYPPGSNTNQGDPNSQYDVSPYVTV